MFRTGDLRKQSSIRPPSGTGGTGYRLPRKKRKVVLRLEPQGKCCGRKGQPLFESGTWWLQDSAAVKLIAFKIIFSATPRT